MDVPSTTVKPPTTKLYDLPTTKKERKASSRSRYGCKSCKARHVKCDETRPLCLRCIRYGFQCDGYINIGSRHEMPLGSTPTLNVNRPLVRLATHHQAAPSSIETLPRQQCNSLPTAITKSKLSKDTTYSQYPWKLKKSQKVKVDRAPFRNRHLSVPMIPYSPSVQLLSSTEEQQYLNYYQTVTADQIPGWSSNLWRYVMLQVAHQNDFAREIILAIGALGKSQEFRGSENSQQLSLGHRQFAFRKYGKALHHIKSSLSQETEIRTVLLSCLLMVCFEEILDTTFEAGAIYTQVGHAMRLFYEWLKGQRVKGTPNSYEGIYSPSPGIIEDELFQAFLLLDLKCMYDFDVRPATVHLDISTFGDATVSNMPMVFDSVTEAELYYSLILRRGLHHLAASRQLAENKSATLMKILEDRLQISQDTAIESDDRSQIIVVAGYKKYIAELQRWNSAFQPVLNKVRRQKGSEDYIRALVLESYLESVMLRFVVPRAEHQFTGSSEQFPKFSFSTHKSEKLVLRPSDIPRSMRQGNTDQQRSAYEKIPMSKIYAGQSRQLLTPVHIYKGVKLGFFNPLEGFAWQTGVAAEWFEERHRISPDCYSDLVFLLESRDAMGKVEIEIRNCNI